MVHRKTNALSRHAGVAAFIALVVALLTPSVAATTCLIPDQGKAIHTLLPTGDLNQEIFNLAVLGRVNFERCLEGLHPLDSHAGLNDAAETHANWMAGESTLSHHSTIVGQSTIEARVKSAMKHPNTGSENIGYVHRYRVDEVSVFFSGSGPCDFKSIAGQEITTHTYSSLAERIVKLWMNSPSHRVNVLDRNATVSATAVAFDGKAQHCGAYYMSQEFAG